MGRALSCIQTQLKTAILTQIPVLIQSLCPLTVLIVITKLPVQPVLLDTMGLFTEELGSNVKTATLSQGTRVH